MRFCSGRSFLLDPRLARHLLGGIAFSRRKLTKCLSTANDHHCSRGAIDRILYVPSGIFDFHSSLHGALPPLVGASLLAVAYSTAVVTVRWFTDLFYRPKQES